MIRKLNEFEDDTMTFGGEIIYDNGQRFYDDRVTFKMHADNVKILDCDSTYDGTIFIRNELMPKVYLKARIEFHNSILSYVGMACRLNLPDGIDAVIFHHQTNDSKNHHKPEEFLREVQNE